MFSFLMNIYDYCFFSVWSVIFMILNTSFIERGKNIFVKKTDRKEKIPCDATLWPRSFFSLYEKCEIGKCIRLKSNTFILFNNRSSNWKFWFYCWKQFTLVWREKWKALKKFVFIVASSPFNITVSECIKFL